MHEFDNRYLWMFAKTIVGSHLANYREGWAANELCRAGRTHPILSRSYPLSEAGQACDDVHDNAHLGKVGVLCLAERGGRGRARRRAARAASCGHHALPQLIS